MSRVLIIVTSLALATSAFAEDKVSWGYAGADGPGNWSTLCAEFGDCAGHNQSPINLTGFVDTDLPPLGIKYKAGGYDIINNGHTVEVHYNAGSTLTMDGIDFTLLQFHFHSPSENQVDGKNFPMECHLVHQAADGQYAVVALMINEGVENPAMKTLWSQMPQAEGDKKTLSAQINVTDLLPADRDYYRYNGSFTTPPCTEGVRWFVLKAPVAAAKDQVKQFTGVMGHPNNRPIQPTNARLILK